MKDLSDRFAGADAVEREQEHADPLTRLQLQAPDGAHGRPAWLAAMRGRVDLLTGACAAFAMAIVAWPHVFPPPLRIPPVVETTSEVAALTVQPLLADGVWTAPDWYGLFNAYQLETTLRDISIRCNYGLPPDARVEHYLHARLQSAVKIQIYLADPGKCPRA